MINFQSPGQEQLYRQVLKGLEGVGYVVNTNQVGPFLKEDYQFTDWFAAGNPRRSVKAVAFAQFPPSHANSAFSVLLADHRNGLGLLKGTRALCAPYAFEVQDRIVNLWAVGAGDSTTNRIASVESEGLAGTFAEHKAEWSAPEMLRLKNVAVRPPSRQATFFDFTLMPAVEHRVHVEIDAMLKDTLSRALLAYQEKNRTNLDARLLFRLAFGLLSAKILHDRNVGVFGTLGPDDIPGILREINGYYKTNRPILEFPPAQRIIAEGLWSGAGLEHVSIESLATIWEETFVSEEDRARLGIHGTPYALAQHVVRNLPFDRYAPEDRSVVEPCCGHGIFLVAALVVRHY